MIRTSAAIAAMAIVLSLLAHGFGLGVTWGRLPQRDEPRPETDVVAMGNAFEDVAEAPSEPVEPEPAPVPEPPVEAAPEPEPAPMPTSDARVASNDPQPVRSPGTGPGLAVQAERSDPVVPDAAPTPEPDAAEPVQSAEPPATPPAAPGTAAEAPRGTPEAAPTPTEVAEAPSPGAAPAPQPPEQIAALPVPVTPAPAPAVVPVVPQAPETVDPAPPETTVAPTPEPPDTVEAEPDTPGSALAVATSPRPRLPAQRPTEQPPGRPDGESDLAQPPEQMVESPITAYLRDGTDLTIGRAGRSRSGGIDFLDGGGQGNSDETNYAGQVLVHLNRSPTVRAREPGFARVFFEINPDGSLAWVNVVESSGSQIVETAARTQVRSAAPFPPPPDGVSRKLTFVYQTE